MIRTEMPREKRHTTEMPGANFSRCLSQMHCQDDQLPHAKLHNHQLPIRHIPKNISIHYYIRLYNIYIRYIMVLFVSLCINL